MVSISSWVPFLTPPLPWRVEYDFNGAHDADEGWAKDTRQYWQRDWRGFAEFFFGQLLAEPHSTKPHEDCVGWAMQTSAETNLLFRDAPLSSSGREESEAVLARVRCPVLAIHGTQDRCQPCAQGERVAELTGGELLLLEGAGHLPFARDPGCRQPRHPGLRLPLPPLRALGRGAARPADLDVAAEPAQAGALRLLAYRARSRPP